LIVLPGINAEHSHESEAAGLRSFENTCKIAMRGKSPERKHIYDQTEFPLQQRQICGGVDETVQNRRTKYPTWENKVNAIQ
jgi:hypothetical protein